MSNRISTLTKSTGVRDPVKAAFRRLCRAAQTPLAKSFVFNDDAKLLNQLHIDPANYRDAASFRVDYLLVSYLSKYKGLKTGIDTREVALRSFATAEAICQETNVRFRKATTCFVDPVLYRAQNLVAKALGVFEREKLDGRERWGPGATSDLPRSAAYLDTKFAELPIAVTAECLPLFRRAIQSDLHWSELILGVFPEGPYSLLNSCFAVVPGAKIETVDKNAKTDRTIAIEPRGNMFLQKAVGAYVRKRLKRCGVDLDNQGLNQELAAKAVDLDLATIDLSMASDTVSRQLVLQLLPLDWAMYLDQIRSKRYVLHGETHEFEKFSSMGNGFTFELESLLFWALTKASMQDETEYFAIYGDDIILPSSDAWSLITVLSYCGFTTNNDKSFVEGPFRESCGRHYFDGVDVTPVYQKEVISDDPSTHQRFCNRLKRYAVKHNDGDRLDPMVNSVWTKAFGALGTSWRPLIPCGTEGDDGYVVTHKDIETFGLRLSNYSPNYGYKWDVLIKRISKIPANERALLAYALRLSGGSAGRTQDLSYVRVKDLQKPFSHLREYPEARYGDLESRDESVVTYTRVTRRIEPSWEFALS